MEHLYPTLAVLFLSFVTLCLFFLFHRHWSNYSAPNLPPGRPGFPLIGETLDFLSTGWHGHPERFIFDRVSRYASHVFKSNLFSQPMAVFCGPAANKFLFSNENKLVAAWWPESVNKVFPSSLQTSANEEAIKVRKLLPQFLKPEALKGYVAVMDQVAHRHFVSDWETKTEVLVFPLAKKYTFQVACRLFLSIDDPAEVARFFDPFAFIASGIISLPVDLPGTPFNKGIKASKVIRKELLKVIEQRRKDLVAGKATAAQDILSHMATCGETMTDLDIADKILGLLIGGHDTASAACTFIVKFLAEYPDIYHGVFKEQMEIVKSKAEGEALNWADIQKMKYSWNVACEVMRIAPPLQGAFREALNDFTFEGFFIPKGWKLYWSTHSTHKDPKWFPEPEKFDPSRFEGDGPAPYTFVPFGGGPRMCPGKEYARLEILVFMHNLVKRFKWEKLLPQEGIIVDPLPMPAKGLPVRLYNHHA